MRRSTERKPLGFFQKAAVATLYRINSSTVAVPTQLFGQTEATIFRSIGRVGVRLSGRTNCVSAWEAEMRKQLLLAGVAVVALMGSLPSQAADLGLPLKAPPAPRPTWTGCYVGGHVGLGWGNKDISDQPGTGLVGGAGASVNNDISGALAGGQIGCDYQFANNWVIGLEGAASGADINGNATSIFNGKSLYARTDFLASATGRVGYTWDQLLFYVKGGAAWAGDRYAVTETGALPNSYNLSETRFGWTVGVGADLALWTTRWSVRFEYDFYDFGTNNNLFFACTTSGGAACGTRGPESIKQEINEFKAGINYRFY
jgi:outer membrane immunogenic protein